MRNSKRFITITFICTTLLLITNNMVSYWHAKSLIDQSQDERIAATMLQFQTISDKSQEISSSFQVLIHAQLNTDQRLYQHMIKGQFQFLIFLNVMETLLIGLCLFAALRWAGKSRPTLLTSSQELEDHKVEDMFATIRGQRHDFLNHIQTMYALMTKGKMDEQMRYMEDLMEEISEVNDLLNIGQPAIAALIQTKIAHAKRNHIPFTYELAGLEELSLVVKPVDLVKIMGNLIDNALDEASTCEVDAREVTISGWKGTDHVHMVVTNSLDPASKTKEYEKLFKLGYTTKENGEHLGLGLVVVKERVGHYNGTIEVGVDGGRISFQVSIPFK